MSHFLTHLRLPKKQSPEAFVTYMAEGFMGDIKPTPRIGVITKVTLLQGNFTDTTHEFILLTEWAGNVHSPLEFLKEGNGFAKFKAKVKELGDFEEVASILNPAS